MSRRTSIYTDGFHHENPVPAACRVGNLVMTGAVHGGGKGSDPTQFSEDAAEQCAVMFGRVADILDAAGGTTDDIIKFSVRVASAEVRAELNSHWTRQFPDPQSRPARQVTVGTTQPHILVQCEVVAMVDAPQ